MNSPLLLRFICHPLVSFHCIAYNEPKKKIIERQRIEAKL